jgi:hypothetical protein
MNNDHIPDDDFDDFDSAEEDLLREDSANFAGVVTQHNTALLRSNFSEKLPRSSTSSTPEMCVVSS